MFIVLIYVYYLFFSLVLIPVAFILSIIKKIKAINLITSKKEFKKKIMDHIFFFVFGPVILTFNVIGDAYYFWENNFRDNLKMIIVEKEIN